MKTKRILALLLTIVMIFGMLPMSAIHTDALEGIPLQDETIEEEVPEEDTEYPKDAEYDFDIPGSTISFLDINGELMTEEAAWTEGEAVVERWHVFMYRQTKDDLKLGYSPEGELFLPYKVYEGETADLLYVKDNTMFRVTATKDAQQTFDGSTLLKEVSLKAVSGETILAYAPVYAESPFGFVYMGHTDENGNFSINSTLGEFRLWVVSNAGYILNKAVTVTESTTEIDFADEITGAVELDIASRTAADPTGPGYVAMLGNPGEIAPANMLTTSYLSPEKTVLVTPGTYSVACAIFLQDYNYDIGEWYSGLWVNLSDSMQISEKTTFSFALADFEGKLTITEDDHQRVLSDDDTPIAPDQWVTLRLYAEDQNGYVIPGQAGSYWSTPNRVVVTVSGVEGDIEYPYTFEIDPFSMLYESYVYSVDDEETVVFSMDDSDFEFSLPYHLFDKTENEYVLKYRSTWDSNAFPELFPSDEWATVTFKTQAVSKKFKTPSSLDYVYYIDEDGKQQEVRFYDYDDQYNYYIIPDCVKNGDSIVLVTVDWSNDVLDYNIVTVSDALFEEPYVFVPHTEFSSPSFTVKNGEEDEREYEVTINAIIELDNGRIVLPSYDAPKTFPHGEYSISVTATYGTYVDIEGEEIRELIYVDYISHEGKYTLSEATHVFEIDYSEYKSFGIDACTPERNWYGDNYKKQFALHFADGAVRYIDWSSILLNMHTDTLPEYVGGEMYWYETMEMAPFSPYVAYEKFKVEEGKTYQFDFTPAAIEFTGENSFASNENTVLSYQVTDGFGNVMSGAWNLINRFITHRPLKWKEYPFRGEDGFPVDNQYTVDVYYRLKGEAEYRKASFTNYNQADLGLLAVGEYEGYIEINLDTYRDEYLVEYPIEKGIMYDESWGEFNSVYDNIHKILHGTFRDEFTFTVTEQIHEHIWSEWTPDGDENHKRTCSAEGCTVITETAPHAWDNGVETQAPTCTEAGVKTFTCSDCNATKTEDIPALDHDWGEWKHLDDNSHVRDCKRNCGVSQEIKGHEWGDPTPVDGTNHKTTCDICKGELTEKHTWGDWEINQQDEANTHIRYCICNESQTAPHNFDDGVVTEPATHMTAGVKTFTCTDCGYSYTEEIPKTADHEWSDWYSNQDGTHSRSCACNEVETEDCEWGDGVVDIPPTHTELGTMLYICTVCQATKKEDIPMLTEHEWGEWVENKTDSTTHIRFCICNESQTAPHNFDEGEVTEEATHTHKGTMTFTCTDCGYSYTEEIPETTEHEWSDWTSNQDGTHTRSCRCNATETKSCTWNAGVITKQPTHYEEGEKTFTCTACGHTKTESVAKTTAHEWSDWAKKDDRTHIRECKCGKTEIKDHRFDNGKVTKAATHTSKGVKTFTCVDCGYTYNEEIPATPSHEWTKWVPNDNGTHTRSCRCNATETKACEWDDGVVTEQPSHVEPGTKTYTCTVCGNTKTEDIPVLTDHEWGEWVENKTDSTTHIRFCICNESQTAPHSFDEGKVTEEATHTSKGVKTYTCTDCGYSYTEDIPETTEHEWTDWASNQDGTHTRSCRCNATETKNCEWDSGKATQQPTHVEPGSKTYTCTVCGNTKTEEIPTTSDHEWTDWTPDKDGTHTRSCACNQSETVACTWDEGTLSVNSETGSFQMVHQCTVCKNTNYVPVTGAAVHFENCEGLEESSLVFVQSGDETTYSVTLPSADDISARDGYVFIGWTASIDGITYSGGNELFIKYADGASITFTAEWATVLGEGEHELEEGTPYYVVGESFELDGEGIVYRGEQVFYVSKSGKYTLINLIKKEEVDES